MKSSLVLVSAALSLFVVSSCSDDSSVGASDVASVDQTVVREVELSVPSISCASCLASIRKEVIQVPGVVGMGGDPRTKKVVVRLNSSAAAGDDAVIAAVKRAGFEPAAGAANGGE